MRPVFRNARPGDYPELILLLQQAGLSTDDFSGSRFEWFSVVAGASLLAAGAIEPFGSCGLLRSVVVREEARGARLGSALVTRLEQRAAQDGINSLVLLTERASAFFEALGYERVSRESMPERVRSSRQFSSDGAGNAVCLCKHLPVLMQSA